MKTLLPRQKALAFVRDFSVALLVFTVFAPVQGWAQLVSVPSPAAFGNVSVGTTQSLTETFTNSGSRRLTIRQASVSGTGFAMKSCPLPITLYPGKSATCSLGFTPNTAAGFTGTMSISWKASSGYLRTAKVLLSGTGVSTAQGTAAATPTSLNFGTLQTGTSKTLNESIANTGGAALTISQVGVSGSGFSINGINPPVTLSVGQSATFNVVFAPASATTATGTVSVASNASNPSLAIPLAGTATSPGQLTVTPASASFGSVVVGTQLSQTVTLSAVGGPVTVSSIGINGPQFSVSGVALPLSLTTGQSAPFTLTFAPQVTGSATGTVGFISASGSATQSVSGTGTAAPQHSVTLNWSPSTSSDVIGYNIYKASQSGGPYNGINTGINATTTYLDTGVQAGQTYYYVVTAVNGTGLQSGYSNQVQAVIPYP